MTDQSTPSTPHDDDALQETAPVVPAPADGELFDQADLADAPRSPHALKPVVEALIFASPEPITVKAMTRLLDDQKKEDVEAAVSELRDNYQGSAGLQLVEVAGGYQIVTRPELYEWVRRLFKER